SHRVLVDANGVPLAELDHLVLDLDPRGSAHDDVDLLLVLVLVAERDPEAWIELHQAQTESLAVERGAREAGLKCVRHVEPRRGVLDVPQVLLRVPAHADDSVRTTTIGNRFSAETEARATRAPARARGARDRRAARRSRNPLSPRPTRPRAALP